MHEHTIVMNTNFSVCTTYTCMWILAVDAHNVRSRTVAFWSLYLVGGTLSMAWLVLHWTTHLYIPNCTLLHIE